MQAGSAGTLVSPEALDQVDTRASRRDRLAERNCSRPNSLLCHAAADGRQTSITARVMVIFHRRKQTMVCPLPN